MDLWRERLVYLIAGVCIASTCGLLGCAVGTFDFAVPVEAGVAAAHDEDAQPPAAVIIVIEAAPVDWQGDPCGIPDMMQCQGQPAQRVRTVPK